MSKVDKLVKLMSDKFSIELDANTFERTRAGYFQRGLGAWSWSMKYKSGISADFGSQESVTEILKNKGKIKIYQNEIVIEHN